MKGKKMVDNYYVDVQKVNNYDELGTSEENFSFDTKEAAKDMFDYIDKDYLNIRVDEKTSKFYVTISDDNEVIEEKYVDFK